MDDQRRCWITQVALSSLEQWYVTWDMFQRYGSGEVKRRALCAKAHGLVWHDRHLAKGMEVFHD